MQSRQLSLDVFRGMVIFFMILVNTPGSWEYVYPPLLHAKWHGCTPTDLVFPGFLFIVGISMYLSMKKALESGINLNSKIVKRAGLIFLIGLLLNWFPFYHKHISDLRIFGVLQRIALSFLVAGLIIHLFKKRNLLVVSAIALLVIHTAILYLFGGEDPLSLEGNFSGQLDILLVGKEHVYGGFGIPFDPEGLLGTLTGAAHVIIAYLIMQWLTVHNDNKKLLVLGVAMILSGLLLDLVLPINKPLWTASYVIYTIGILTTIWCIIRYIVDERKIDKWTYVFKVFGRNPLISYALSVIFSKILYQVIKLENGSGYSWLYKNIFQNTFGDYLGSLFFAISFTLFTWLFALILFKRKIIIKV